MHARTLIGTIILLTGTTLTTARAEQSECAGWFCEQEEGANVDVALRDGRTLRGVIVATTPQYLTLRIAGATITVAWGDVLGVHVAVGDPPTKIEPNDEPVAEAPADIEPEATKPEPKPAPKVVVVESVPVDPPPSAVPRRAERLDPLSLGLRLKMISPFEGSGFLRGSGAMTDYVLVGPAYELAMSVRLSRAISIRGSYEGATFSPGERNLSSERPRSHLLGIGVRARTGPRDDVQGVFELGIAYRWLTVPYRAGAAPDSVARSPVSGEVTYEGGETMRGAIGLSFPLADNARAEVLLEGAFGRFSRVNDRNILCNSSRPCTNIAESDRVTHAFGAIALGIELGP